MKLEPLPGAQFTVSESRRGGATQGHAYDECKARLWLARYTAPLQLYMVSATAIGVTEAIMVSNWALLVLVPPMYTRAVSGRPTTEVFCIPGEVRSFVARIRSNWYRRGYTRRRLKRHQRVTRRRIASVILFDLLDSLTKSHYQIHCDRRWETSDISIVEYLTFQLLRVQLSLDEPWILFWSRILDTNTKSLLNF